MRLLIRQRVFSWTDTYDVYDEYESPKYYVKAEFFTLGHQIHVYNKRTDQEVGAIYQKLLTLMPKFEIEMYGRIIGMIQKQFTLFHPRYEIDCNGWSVDGSFWGWDYDVVCGSSSIMHISKEPFRWGDTYVIDFQNPADELMGLLLVIAIDAANCNNNG